MSDLKHDAIVSSGIPIHKRYEIPEDLVNLFSFSLSLARPSLLLAAFLYNLTNLSLHFSRSLVNQIPPDSRVEIDAKIAAGYYSEVQVTDLSKTAGRLWEDLQH